MNPDNSHIIHILNDSFAKLSLWSLQHRWWVLGLCMLVLGVSVYFAQQVRMNNGFDSFFNEHDPVYLAYNQYREDFGSDEVGYLLYDASEYEHGVFNYELMSHINTLSTRLENEVPFVKDVTSITNSEVLLPYEDGIEIIKLEESFPENQQALLQFAEKYMAKPIYIGGFVSSDRSHGAISLDMSRSSVDPIHKIRLDPEAGNSLDNLYPQASYNAINQILAEAPFKDIKFYFSGDVALNSEFNYIAFSDMGTTMSLSFIVVALLLFYFFRGNVLGVIGPLVVVILSIVITVGFMGIMNWDMDLMFSLVPTLLIAIGVAQAVHILSEFRITYSHTLDRHAAIRETLEQVGTPCLLTSLTTAAGFLAMSISPIKSISHMAVYTGMAVLAAFFLSLTLLTFFLSFGKPQSRESIEIQNHNPRLAAFLSGISQFTINYPKQIVLVFFLLCVLAGIGLSKVSVDSNFLLDFRKDEPIRVTSEYIDNTMGGTGSLVYLFDTGSSDGIKNPEVLREIDRVQQQLNNKTPLVKKTYSIVDLIKDINQSFHDGNPEYYRIPDSQELVAQYLLVYELSGGEELADFVSSDYSRANIEVRMQISSSSVIARLKQDMEAYLQQQPLLHTEQAATGIGALWIQLMDYITDSQLRGVVLAFTVITLLMCLIFRSLKIGLISMIPNIAPAALTVGLIGWLDVHLDYTKLLVAPIAIGIAVDDTIHLLTRFHNEFKRHRNYQQALKNSMNTVGRALMITSVVLVAGFSMLTFATLESQVWFGILLSLTILLALVADFLVMPALILLTKPFGRETDPIKQSE